MPGERRGDPKAERGHRSQERKRGRRPYPPSRESSESCRRHCTCPVLWAAQLIHSPSWSPTAVMMASPAYELCRHCGSTAAARAATQPARAARNPASSRAPEPIAAAAAGPSPARPRSSERAPGGGTRPEGRLGEGARLRGGGIGAGLEGKGETWVLCWRGFECRIGGG